MADPQPAAATLIHRAVEAGTTIVTAESCTAGALARALAAEEGAGRALFGGFIVYTKDAKSEVLGVSPALLAERSAVCRDVALAMARGAIDRTSAGLAIAVTGVAGPEPDEDGNPVGLVHVAVADRAGATGHETFRSAGATPAAVQQETISRALALALRFHLQSQFTAPGGR